VSRRANGEGTIYPRKDGRWEVAYFSLDGRRVRLLRATRAEARRALATAIAARKKARPSSASASNDTLSFQTAEPTLAAFAEVWLPAMRPRIRYQTWRRYRQLLLGHVLPVIGQIQLARLTGMHVQRATNQMLERGLSSTTAHHAHSVLHGVLRDALEADLVTRNVAANTKAPPLATGEMKTLSPEQANALLCASKGHSWEALWVVALTTGMRKGELLGLRWTDIDLDHALVHITSNLARGPQGLELGRPKTHRSRRPVRLSRLAVDALRRHKSRQATDRLRAGAAWEDRNLVFCGNAGSPASGEWLVRGPFRRLLSRAGLPNIRFHDLRHTAATLWFRSGLNPKVVQETLGHSRVSITLDTYSHMIPDLQQEAARVMDDLFPQLEVQEG
jgi:integrase